jgi:hypothetical protein
LDASEQKLGCSLIYGQDVLSTKGTYILGVFGRIIQSMHLKYGEISPPKTNVLEALDKQIGIFGNIACEPREESLRNMSTSRDSE